MRAKHIGNERPTGPVREATSFLPWNSWPILPTLSMTVSNRRRKRVAALFTHKSTLNSTVSEEFREGTLMFTFCIEGDNSSFLPSVR